MSLPSRPEPFLRLRDNPLFLAQARRRLRGRATGPVLAIAAILALCGLLAVKTLGHGIPESWRFLSMVLLGFIGFELYLRATPLVGWLMTEERASGILDFHRATPLSPLTLAVGYLLGCPSREYLVAAIFAAALLVAAPAAQLPLAGVAIALAAVVVSAWLYHAFSMLAGLTINLGRRQSSAVTILLLFLLLGSGGRAGTGLLLYLTPLPAVFGAFGGDFLGQAGGLAPSFFGLSVPPVLHAFLFQGVLLLFLLWACARRLRNESLPAFSRTGAMALFALLSLFALGAGWEELGRIGAAAAPAEQGAALLAVYLGGTTLLASLLLVSLVPGYLGFVRCLRRARRLGRPAAAWLEDGASAWPLIPAFTALTAAAQSGLWAGLGHGPSPGRWLAFVAALGLLLAFLAGAVEFVRMAWRAAWRNGALLIGFCAFVLPFLLMGILSGADQELGRYCALLSPLYPLALAWSELAREWGGAGPFGDSAPVAGLGLALLPTALVTACFLWRTHRLRRALADAIPLGEPARMAAGGPAPQRGG